MDKFKIRQYLYYIIIGVLSFISLVFLPMIGSDVNLKPNIPNTPMGWAVYIVVKLSVAIINILIFHCFMQQAKINIKDNENYKKANDILQRSKNKLVKPLSPSKWLSKQYLSKGSSIFAGTVLGTVVIGDALLKYNTIVMLTYLFVIVMGLIFGIMQMKSAECYWTNEYYEYALLKELEDKEQAEKEEQEKCLNIEETNTETLKNKSETTNETSNKS